MCKVLYEVSIIRQILFSWAPKSLQMVTAAMKLKDSCSWERSLWQTLLFSHSVMSNFLWPHGVQHARLPWPSLSLEFAQTHVHWVDDAIQLSHPLLPPSPLALNLSQHQGFFQWVSSLHQVAKILKFQLQHQSFQWIFRGLISFRIYLLSLAVQGTVKHRQTQHIQKQRCHFADKSPYSQSYAFSSSHVWMWELDHKEGWRIDAFELWCWRRLLSLSLDCKESPSLSLDCKEIKPANPEENQLYVFFRRTDTKAEAPILWPPDVKGRLTEKHPDAGKDWRQEEKRVAESEIVGQHHRLHGHESEQTPGDSEG